MKWIVFFIFLLLSSTVFGFEGSIIAKGIDTKSTIIFGADDLRSYVPLPPSPPSAPFLDMYILEKEGKMHRSIKGLEEDLSYFVFLDYETKNENKNVTISGNFDEIPNEYEIYLIYENKKIDLREQNYTISPESNFEIRLEKIIDVTRETPEVIQEEKNYYLDEIVLISLLLIVIIILLIKRRKSK